MKKYLRLFVFGIVCVFWVLGIQGCVSEQGSSSTKKEVKELTIAYQGGIGYAPVHIIEEKGLIGKNYEGNVNVKFVKLDSGAAINEGIIGGTIDVGCMGLAPAISGVSKGIPYKAIANLCSQSHGLMSNDPRISALSEITPADKIALVSAGSLQHILLGMAAERVLGDAHALDNNIQRMSHAEGMAALESGTVKLHLTSSPFIYQERVNKKYIELPEIREVWPGGNTFLVAMAAVSLEKDEALFDAVNKSFTQAIDFIQENPEDVVKIEGKYLNLQEEKVKNYMEQPDCQFFKELRGMKDMADFMQRVGFIERSITLEEFCYPSVSGI